MTESVRLLNDFAGGDYLWYDDDHDLFITVNDYGNINKVIDGDKFRSGEEDY